MAEDKKEEKKKHVGKSVYRSQFSMGMKDMERFNEILYVIDEYGIQFDCGNDAALRPYFAACKRFYMNVSFLVIDTKKVEDLIDSIQKDIDSLDNKRLPKDIKTKIIWSVREKMDKLSGIIYTLKPKIGLGIEVVKMMGSQKRWNIAAGIGKD